MLVVDNYNFDCRLRRCGPSKFWGTRHNSFRWFNRNFTNCCDNCTDHKLFETFEIRTQGCNIFKKRLQQEGDSTASCYLHEHRYYLSKHSKLKYHNVGTYESALFESLSRFRELKRYVLSHDGTDATDKQITVLETMEVNIDDLRSKLEILETSLLEEKKEMDANVPENSALPFGMTRRKGHSKRFPR